MAGRGQAELAQRSETDLPGVGAREGPVDHRKHWILSCEGLWADVEKDSFAAVLKTDCGEAERKQGDPVGHWSE